MQALGRNRPEDLPATDHGNEYGLRPRLTTTVHARLPLADVEETPTRDSSSETVSLPRQSNREPPRPAGSLTHNRGAAARTEAGKRIKWTRAMNIDVVRCFFIVNQCQEDPLPGWRARLFEEFRKLYLNLEHLSEQNVADRKNVIFRKRYLSDVEISQIRKEATDLLKGRQSEATRRNEVTVPIVNPTEQSDGAEYGSDLDVDALETTFLSHAALYEMIRPQDRPRLPRLIQRMGAAELLHRANATLERHLHGCEDIHEINTALYAAAVTVLELNGQQVLFRNCDARPLRTAEREQPWQTRLKRDVDNLRSLADTIREYLMGIRSPKINKKIANLLRRYKMRRNHPSAERHLLLTYDELRQKAKAKGARLRRYNQMTRRKTQNKRFAAGQRSFYDSLSCEKSSTDGEIIDRSRFLEFWRAIWSGAGSYNKQAAWIEDVVRDAAGVVDMQGASITKQDVQKAVKNTHNWKAPGPDRIQNFWIKKLHACHEPLARAYSRAIENPDTVPEYLTEGITYLLHKKDDPVNPKNYRPITCLSNVYKLLTSIIGDKIYSHCEANNIFSFEQRGCIKGAMGCKEQLTIDTIILKHAQLKKRNLFTCYVDYAKAFDSVPHDWLLRVLRIYKVCPEIQNLLSVLSATWKSTLMVKNVKLGTVNIERGIFQGDSLSPLWFCLALNPLTHLLNNNQMGFRFEKQERTRVSHLMYMDDLKLFAESENQLVSLINTTKFFSNDIRMQFGLDKCAVFKMKKGRVLRTMETVEDIKVLDSDNYYKYLGFQQNPGLEHTRIKSELKQKYVQRVTKLLNTKLNSRNLTVAINTWAVPILGYSFGIIKWSGTDLAELDRTTRRLLTKFRMLDPKSATERLYLRRAEGGRGLINIEQHCRNQVAKLRTYFQTRTHTTVKGILPYDRSFTPMNMATVEMEQPDEADLSSRLLESWKGKALHGRYPNSLDGDNIDKKASTTFITTGYLHPETEGFLFAIQDKVIRTRNYERHIMHLRVEDNCRRCGRPGETIEHVIAGCGQLSNSAYLSRHNQVAKIIHQQLAVKNGLIKSVVPYYKYTPNPVLENETSVLYWDRLMITDKSVDFNRPDIVLVNKKERKGYIADIAVPLTTNIFQTECQKIDKYQNLAIELKRIWKLRDIIIVPLVVSAEGAVSKRLPDFLVKLGLPQHLGSSMQKAAILQTCHIVRKFMSPVG